MIFSQITESGRLGVCCHQLTLPSLISLSAISAVFCHAHSHSVSLGPLHRLRPTFRIKAPQAQQTHWFPPWISLLRARLLAVCLFWAPLPRSLTLSLVISGSLSLLTACASPFLKKPLSYLAPFPRINLLLVNYLRQLAPLFRQYGLYSPFKLLLFLSCQSAILSLELADFTSVLGLLELAVDYTATGFNGGFFFYCREGKKCVVCGRETDSLPIS